MELYVWAASLWCLTSAHAVMKNYSEVKHLVPKKHNHASKNRPFYHILSPHGWVNVPCAFAYYMGYYHIFYQYIPFELGFNPMRWGHVASTNFIDWIYFPPPLVPDKYYDKNGCFAGSLALHSSENVVIFYTGIRYDLNQSYVETQNIAVSQDGLQFEKFLYNPITRHLNKSTLSRNPHVGRRGSSWYMLTGSELMGHGALLLFTSPDLFNWSFNRTLARSYGDMGSFWESPGFFKMHGISFLLLSIHDMKSKKFQSGYVEGFFTPFSFKDLEISKTTFKKLDHGHDFYAPQTMKAPDGRWLLLAWLGTWSDPYFLTEAFSSSLTIVRELNVSAGDHLVQKPIMEMAKLRKAMVENAWYLPEETFRVGTRSFEILLTSNVTNVDVGIDLEWGTLRGEGRFSIDYRASERKMSVDRGGLSGRREAEWLPAGPLSWRVFVDVRSVEVFCGEGELVFTSRVAMGRGVCLKITGQGVVHLTVYKLRRLQFFTIKF